LRPVWGAGELLWKVSTGAWYGWPDFSGDKEIDRMEFRPPHQSAPPPLFDKEPGDVPKPAAILPVHSSADGFDFSTSPDFGYEGQAFVAEFGDMAPSVGKVLEPVGFKVVRVDVNRGVTEDFAVNRRGPNGPASLQKSGGLERPVAVRFSAGGRSLYVVDFGVMTVSGKGSRALRRTGVIWRIWKEKEAQP
jgi:glucose/arabinose dehydrogenase